MACGGTRARGSRARAANRTSTSRRATRDATAAVSASARRQYPPEPQGSVRDRAPSERLPDAKEDEQAIEIGAHVVGLDEAIRDVDRDGQVPGPDASTEPDC